MSTDRAFHPWDGATLPPGGASHSDHPHRRPALRVRAVDGTAVFDIINVETLCAEEDISHLANQLSSPHEIEMAGETRSAERPSGKPKCHSM
jgi:hypothetical protein